VTLRAVSGLGSLRAERPFRAVHTALGVASRNGFRILQFSVQRDHLHLLVEAEGPTAFERGVRGLAIRVAKAVNRILGRHGAVWGDRYHAHLLRTPREVRNALIYVLNNWLKHVPGARGLDPRSSAEWFEGWSRLPIRSAATPLVARPRTWLANVGWRSSGLIDVDARPKTAPSS
jgi:hypothetical protein